MLPPCKVLVLAVLGCCITISNANMAEVLHNKCIEEHPFNPDLIERAKVGKFVKNANFKCYLKCITTGLGVMQENGTFEVDETLLKNLGADPSTFASTIAIAYKCRDKHKEEDLCERAYQYHRCNQKENPSGYIVF